jgi:nucleotide-binding universal stress UspA family protein
MDAKVRTIVVGASDVDPCDLAVTSAAAIARRHGATLHVVHAYDLPNPIQAAYARELFLDSDVLDRYGEELRTRLEASCGEAVRGCHVTFHTVEGSAAECIAEMTQEVEADLAVVGASRGGRLWQQFLGTTAEGVIRHARAPVLVLRRPLADGAARVLLTTDLTPGSATLQCHGVRLVRALFGDGEPTFRCLLAVQTDTLPLEMRGEVLERVAGRELQQFLAHCLEDHTAVEGRVRVGSAVPAVLGEAAEWHADLLVVGAHGRRTDHRFLLGSVSGGALRGASTNVLVVPVTTPEPPPRDPRGASAATRTLPASLLPRSRSARQHG